MLVYTEEQQRIFLDVLKTFIWMDDKQSAKEKELLSHLQNDVFKNSSYFIQIMDDDKLPNAIKKLDMDIYLVHLFNLLYNLADDPDFDKTVISKEKFIKKIDSLLDSLGIDVKNKIEKNKIFHKSKDGYGRKILEDTTKYEIGIILIVGIFFLYLLN